MEYGLNRGWGGGKYGKVNIRVSENGEIGGAARKSPMGGIPAFHSGLTLPSSNAVRTRTHPPAELCNGESIGQSGVGKHENR